MINKNMDMKIILELLWKLMKN